MDKMNKNEFYNRINSKFLYPFEVKLPHLSLKTDFSSNWSQNDRKILPHVEVKIPY